VDRQVVVSTPLVIHARPLSPTLGAQSGLDALTMPQFPQADLGGADERLGNGPLPTLPQGARPTGAGLAVGGGGEIQAAEVAQFGDGDVAVEDLLEDEVGGDHRPEVAVAPAVADLLSQTADEGLGERVGEAALDLDDGFGDR